MAKNLYSQCRGVGELDPTCCNKGLPRRLSGESPPANTGAAGDVGSIPGSGSSLRGVNGN